MNFNWLFCQKALKSLNFLKLKKKSIFLDKNLVNLINLNLDVKIYNKLTETKYQLLNSQ